jgi:hypothetical protein
MQNNLQPGLGNSPPRRRPSPYDLQPNQGQNPYQPQRRPLPPNPRPNPPPQQTYTQHHPTEAYQSAYDLLQSAFLVVFTKANVETGHRPAGSFYPEANIPKPSPSKSPEIVSPRPQRYLHF